MLGRLAYLSLAVTAVAALVVIPAFGLGIPGTKGNDVLRGTAKADTINGKAGDDRVFGRGANDTLTGGAGKDALDGGPGNDKLLIRDGARDTATCGAGRDRVTADAVDVVRANCETVLKPPVAPLPTLGTTRENPFPLGRAGAVGNGWTVTVTAVQRNATDLVLAADEFNEPPGDGNQFFMISVSAVYNGSGTSSLGSALAMRAIGESAVEYGTFENSCGVIPDPNLEIDDPEVSTGGTVTGNGACWEIASSDAASLVMFYVDSETEKTTWFALR